QRDLDDAGRPGSQRHAVVGQPDPQPGLDELEAGPPRPQQSQLLADALGHPLWNLTFLPNPCPGLSLTRSPSARVRSVLPRRSTSTICWPAAKPASLRMSAAVIVSRCHSKILPSMLTENL